MILLIAEILLLSTLVYCEKLTFLGGKNPKESMVRYSNWYAKEKAALNFQFKTAKENGILFYIQGDSRHVHMRLALENGRLSFIVSHSTLEHIAEDFGTYLNDMNWHNVTVVRNHRSTLFELDGTQRVMTKLHWKEVLDLKSDLYVGFTNDAEPVEAFVGCIKDLKYGEGYNQLTIHTPEFQGLNVINGCEDFCAKVASPDCNAGTCVNKFTSYTCDCFGTGYTGSKCDKESEVISLQGKMDFMSRKVNPMRSLKSNKLYLRFKTLDRDGILFTLGKANDYLTVEIFDGRIRVESNVGGGKIVIESERPLNDGMWHDVKVIQNGGKFKLVVDHRNKSRFEKTVPSPYEYVDSSCLSSDFAYFGGHFNPITVIGSKSKQGFVGCLQQFFFNKVDVVKDSLRAADILEKTGGKQSLNTEIDGKITRGCNIKPRPIKDVITVPKSKAPQDKKSQTKQPRPTILDNLREVIPEASTIQQTPKAGKREKRKLEKSSVAWITAGLVIGALVIILVMAFLIHRFRKKYRGTFMAPRDENGTPYYSSVQATYHMPNGVGKRHHRGNATDV